MMSLVEPPAPRPRTPIKTPDSSDSGYESLLSQAASIQLRDSRTSRAAPGHAPPASSHVAKSAPAEAGLAGRRATGFNGLYSFDKPGVCIKDYVEVQNRIDEGLMSSLKRSEGPPVSLRLGILGKSQQDARPHLIIFCSKKQAKRAEAFLKKTRIKKLLESEDLTAGPLRVIVCDQAPTLTVFAEYRKIHIATSGDWVSSGSSSCGLPIRIYSSGTGQFRKSTLGGIIRVITSDGSSDIFGITAGHPFEQYRDSGVEPGSGSDSDDSDSSSMSGSNGSVQSITHETSNAWEFQGFHECQAILSPVSTQCRDVQDHYWDWTLIKLREWQPNRVRHGNGWQTLTEPAKNFRQRALYRKVEMLSASSGPVPGSLHFAGSKLCISPGKMSIETFIFEPEELDAIENGDSGSWVVDLQTREVYGHIVAADCFGGAYVVPIDALFRDIKQRLEAASVELPSYYNSLPCVFEDFRTFVQDSQQQGEYGDGTPAKYVSPQKLAEYWTTDMIERSLELDSQTRENKGAIDCLKGTYMVVFSILAYISKVGHSATSYIGHFIAMGEDDNTLPFQSMPSALVGLPYCSQVYADFSAAQWMFYPLIIQQRDAPRGYLELRTGRILAARSLGKPPESVSITDEEVEISRSRSESEKITVILKSYSKDIRAFRHDLDTWSLIQKLKQPGQHVLSIIDAFNIETPSGERKILVTERPELGTLLDLFRQNSPPYTQEDVRIFWNSILSLLGTINIVHRQMQSNLHLRFCDLLSPSDISVFTESNSSSGSGYRLKLNMLAGNRFRTGKAAVSVPYHERGPYYAPEFTYDGPSQDDSPADIWSFGCLVVETASWLIGGERGRIDFQNCRKHEIDGFPKSLGEQLGNCFHDGENTLNSVRDVYKLATKYSRRSDDITSKIVGVFLRGALAGSPARRFPARQLQMSAQMILDDEIEGISSSRRSSTCREDTFDMKHRVSTSYFSGPRSHASSRTSIVSAQYVANSHSVTVRAQSPPSSIAQKSVRESSIYSVGSQEKGIPPSRQLLFNRHEKEGATFSQARFPFLAPQGVERNAPLSSLSISSNSEPIDSGIALSAGRAGTPGYQLYPHITLTQVMMWIDEKKKASRGSVRGFRQGQISLPGQDLALKALSNRDITFLVDNSTTMQAYKGEVIDTFHALAYLAKQVDSDGIEVFLSSRPDSRLQARNTSSLVKYVQSHFSPGRLEFGLGPCLQKVAGDVLSTSNQGRKSSKAKGKSLYILTDGVWDHSDTGVIRNSIHLLGAEIKRRKLNRTDIMIQFIRFGDSTAAAQRLQLLDDDLSIADYDIVDTKSCKDNVWSMLVGSIAESMDVTKNESDDERIGDIGIDS